MVHLLSPSPPAVHHPWRPTPSGQSSGFLRGGRPRCMQSHRLHAQSAKSVAVSESERLAQKLESSWKGEEPLPGPLLDALRRQPPAAVQPSPDSSSSSSSNSSSGGGGASGKVPASGAALDMPRWAASSGSIVVPEGFVKRGNDEEAPHNKQQQQGRQGGQRQQGQQAPLAAPAACTVAVCTDKPCSRQGAWPVLAAFRAAAAAAAAGDSEGRQAVSVSVVSGMCLGMCKAGPNVRVVGCSRNAVHTGVSPGGAEVILRGALREQPS